MTYWEKKYNDKQFIGIIDLLLLLFDIEYVKLINVSAIEYLSANNDNDKLNLITNFNLFIEKRIFSIVATTYKINILLETKFIYNINGTHDNVFFQFRMFDKEYSINVITLETLSIPLYTAYNIYIECNIHKNYEFPIIYNTKDFMDLCKDDISNKILRPIQDHNIPQNINELFSSPDIKKYMKFLSDGIKLIKKGYQPIEDFNMCGLVPYILKPDEQEYNCTITQEPLVDCSYLLKTNCNHIFDGEAITMYLTNNDTCPDCKQIINSFLI